MGPTCPLEGEGNGGLGGREAASDGNFLPGHPYQLAPTDGYGTRAIQAT